MVVCTFLEIYDLSGKTIVPFFTYAATTYFQQSVDKIVEVTPNSTHLTAFGSTGSIRSVESWLREIGKLGDETGIENTSDSTGDSFSVSVSGKIVNVNIANAVNVDIYTAAGALVKSVSDKGNHSLSLPSGAVYLFSDKEKRTAKKIVL